MALRRQLFLYFRFQKAWSNRLNNSEKSISTAFTSSIDAKINNSVTKALKKYEAKLIDEKPIVATRVASQKTLEVLTPLIPELVGGSADLTGSNNTKTGSHCVIDKNNPDGNYLHYGVREHAMAAAMNGLALHGGIIPYGGTFLVFTD